MTNPTSLKTSTTPGARAAGSLAQGLELIIPPGPAGKYRLAQVDDYRGLPRAGFLHKAPTTIELEARINRQAVPGTWGFGLWNAPLSISIGFGTRRFLPALPNAAWFFFASPENFLSFRSDRPAAGLLAQTFRSAPLPAWLFLPAAPALPLILWRPAAKLIRRAARRLIDEDSAGLTHDFTEWHRYRLDWTENQTVFSVDEEQVLQTPASPRGPLGLVIWVDNQFAAFRPDGSLGFGTLACDAPAALEVQSFRIDRGYNSAG